MKLLNTIAEWLLIFGGFNIGLAIFGMDLIIMIADATVPVMKTVLLSLIGVSAIFKLGRIADLI